MEMEKQIRYYDDISLTVSISSIYTRLARNFRPGHFRATGIVVSIRAPVGRLQLSCKTRCIVDRPIEVHLDLDASRATCS